VVLRVRDLDAMIAFYRDIVGLDLSRPRPCIRHRNRPAAAGVWVSVRLQHRLSAISTKASIPAVCATFLRKAFQGRQHALLSHLLGAGHDRRALVALMLKLQRRLRRSRLERDLNS
jgi:catechol 2,3-dioxygenase-like lactoylglutathione lyase family enzyme